MSSSIDPALQTEYDQLLHHAGVVDFQRMARLEMHGADRQKFLHNLCTNHIQRLTPGEGCEAFVTNVQGKTIGFIYVFCLPTSLRIITAPGQGDVLLPHFDRYLIREDVQLVNNSNALRQWLISGEKAAAVLERAFKVPPPEAMMGTVAGALEAQPIAIHRVVWTAAPSFFITCAAELHAQVGEQLVLAGAASCSYEAAEMARIEAGTPMFGADISAENLPQEVGRDQTAISFQKGCYLGQETVARIDALGHVNRKLVQLRVESSDLPAPHTPLHAGDKVVGKVTSAAWSPRLEAPLALAYIRRELLQVGSRVQSAVGEAEVVDLTKG